jgi:hypothetical protein
MPGTRLRHPQCRLRHRSRRRRLHCRYAEALSYLSDAPAPASTATSCATSSRAGSKVRTRSGGSTSSPRIRWASTHRRRAAHPRGVDRLCAAADCGDRGGEWGCGPGGFAGHGRPLVSIDAVSPANATQPNRREVSRASLETQSASAPRHFRLMECRSFQDLGLEAHAATRSSSRRTASRRCLFCLLHP